MSKFESGQVIWTKHPHLNSQWPAKIIRYLSKKDSYQVIFFAGAKMEKEQIFIIKENASKKFNDCCFDEKESPLELCNAYKLALKEHMKSKQHEVEPASDENASVLVREWGAGELKECFDDLLVQIPNGRNLERVKTGIQSFKLQASDMRIYLRDSFCQKLAFFTNRCIMDNDLYIILSELRQKMRDMLCQAFARGNL